MFNSNNNNKSYNLLLIVVLVIVVCIAWNFFSKEKFRGVLFEEDPERYNRCIHNGGRRELWRDGNHRCVMDK